MRIPTFMLLALTALASACGGTTTQAQNPSVTAAEGMPGSSNSDDTNLSNAATGPSPKSTDGPSPSTTDGETPSSK